jgi:ABC-type oligopeptide transport system substrate-binding subunit
LVEWIHDDHITLEKNNAYYAAQNVQIERVVMWMVDEETAWEKYQAGFLDTTSVLSELLEDVVEGSTLSREVKRPGFSGGYVT